MLIRHSRALRLLAGSALLAALAPCAIPASAQEVRPAGAGAGRRGAVEAVTRTDGSAGAMRAGADGLGARPQDQLPAPGGRSTGIQRLTGVWVEGPGFDVTYGGSYEGCADRCLANGRCVMLEYYRPERKCNLYSSLRPRKVGGASIVGVRN